MNSSATPAAALSRDALLERDRQDPLGRFRERFSLPPNVIYLNGNSLGPPPHQAFRNVERVLGAEWRDGLSRSWNSAGWFTAPSRLGDQLGGLIGAAPGQVVVTDSTSINLFKVLAAALGQRPGRRVILSERDNFPTDLYVSQGLTRFLDQGHELRLVDDPAQAVAALDDDVAVVMLTHVNYRTGRMLDMAAITAQAHARGALVIWDLAHSAGAVPVDLDACDVDFAVGCTYKYLNGGPGAPAFVYVAKRWQALVQQPLSGWWGHARPFAFEVGFEQASDVRGFLCGTQPMLALGAAEAGIQLAAEAGVAAIRAKSLALTAVFIELLEQHCPVLAATLQTPRQAAARGSQVSVLHPNGLAIMHALIARGVIGDYREPGLMRFGMAPLYVRYVDMWDAVMHMRDVMASDVIHQAAGPIGNEVT